MKEKTGIVTMKGKSLTLVGNEVKIGDKAPDFEVIAQDLSTVRFSSFNGKICIISSVPSLDTKICNLQTRRFNSEAEKLGKKIVILTISMDLPFAQSRWCGAASVKNVKVFSDYKNAEFGIAFGVLIKELRLLSRAVFIVDMQGIIKYIQFVPELTEEPDYEAVLKNVRSLI